MRAGRKRSYAPLLGWSKFTQYHFQSNDFLFERGGAISHVEFVEDMDEG